MPSLSHKRKVLVLNSTREEATVRQHVHAPDRIRTPREGGEGVPSLSHKRKVN
jgi:hypothetical protein